MTDKEREELAEAIGKGLASGSKISAEDLQNENTISYKMGEIMEMDADLQRKIKRQRGGKMKEIVIQIKGQIEDDVSTSEVENAIYDNLPVDFETVTVEEV